MLPSLKTIMHHDAFYKVLAVLHGTKRRIVYKTFLSLLAQSGSNNPAYIRMKPILLQYRIIKLTYQDGSRVNPNMDLRGKNKSSEVYIGLSKKGRQIMNQLVEIDQELFNYQEIKCLTCKYEFATCEGNPKFATKGKDDRVIACKEYVWKE